ncbi:unnamed protein product, partial [Brassica napus]
NGVSVSYVVWLSRNKVGTFASFEMEKGITCACFLWRIYEELRQQKEFFGHHCFKFLSIYIWISCGYRPLKTGIKRKNLRPGVEALVDSCSDQDRQYLHTVFGEGPCRNYLAALKQESDLNFKYGRKV